MQSSGIPCTKVGTKQTQHEYWYDERNDSKLVGFRGVIPEIGGRIKLKDPRVGSRVNFVVTRICWIYPYDGSPKHACVYVKPVTQKGKSKR